MTLYQGPDWTAVHRKDDETAFKRLVRLGVLVPVEPDDVMNAAHKLVHPMYDNAADCDKFWCEPFRALNAGIGETP